MLESEKEVFLNKIISVGINNVYKTFDNEQTLNEFYALPLRDIFPFWKELTREARFEIFSAHILEFEAFLKEQAEK